MADEKKKAAAIAGAGITAGALLALLASRPVKAAPPEGVVSLDDPAMQALISILEHAESLDADSDELIAIANRIAAVLGAPTALENPPDITAFSVWTTALTVPIRLPDRVIPYDKKLVIKAWHTNTGVIMVAPSRSAAININSGFPLIASGVAEYEIRNADHVWICCHPTLGMVGDGVACTVEQEATR